MQIANLKPKEMQIEAFNDNDRKKKYDIIAGKNLKTTPTIFSKDLRIEGDITSDGLVEIEGFVKGTIKGNFVIIRENGAVEGDLIAETLNIKGNFQGNIKAKNISISSKATINGVVEYGTLCVEDGACIDGSFRKV